jgi:hypothetical protein
MPNSFLTLKNAPGVIAEASAAMLEDAMPFCKSIEKTPASDFQGMNGHTAGDVIYIDKPPRFAESSTADITSTIQDVVRQKEPLTLFRRVVPFQASSLEFATETQFKEWFNQNVKPALSNLAQFVEKEMISRASLATYQNVGTPGSNAFDTDTVLNARELIANQLGNGDKYIAVSPKAMRAAVNSRKGYFNDAGQVSTAFKKGTYKEADGFTWMESTLLRSQTNGTDVTGVTVKTTVSAQGSTTLVLTGVTATTGTVTAGTTFTISSVNAVHPITKADLGYLQQFTVVTGGAGDVSTDLSVTVSPAMYSSAAAGSQQNITAFPQANATITFTGTASQTFTQNLAYDSGAFRMVSLPLITPPDTIVAEQRTYKGITVRYIQQYDSLKDVVVNRLDFLGGIVAARAEHACILNG